MNENENDYLKVKMNENTVDYRKELKELKNIIKEQNLTIELLKERLMEVADDVDKINGSYYCDNGRTIKWWGNW